MADATRAGELFGERLRELRRKRGITQAVLAEMTGVPQNHISSIERGTKSPNLLMLIRLAAALGCKVGAMVSVFDKQDITQLVPETVGLVPIALEATFRFSIRAPLLGVVPSSPMPLILQRCRTIRSRCQNDGLPNSRS